MSLKGRMPNLTKLILHLPSDCIMEHITPLIATARRLSYLSITYYGYMIRETDVTGLQWSLPALKTLIIPRLPTVICAPLLNTISFQYATTKEIHNSIIQLPSLHTMKACFRGDNGIINELKSVPLKTKLKILRFGDNINLIPIVAQCKQLRKLYTSTSFQSWYVYAVRFVCLFVCLFICFCEQLQKTK